MSQHTSANKFAACIFDLDGTLVDSEILWVKAIRGWLQDRDISISDEASLGLIYGRSWRDIYQRIITQFPGLAMSEQEMERSVRPLFLDLCRNGDIIIPESVELLKRLARDYPVCVVTGSPRHDAEEALARAKIRSCLDFVLASEDYFPGKPDPCGFLLAASRLGVRPGRCLVFEDSLAGVSAARAAGMFCVALARPGRPAQDLRDADMVLTSLADFEMPGQPSWPFA